MAGTQRSTRSLPPTPFFPLARYTSVAGVHASLLVFTALFLPRTSFSALVASVVSGTYDPPSHPTAYVRSADRPQHPFLAPLTADPTATLGWLCVGVILCQAWWAVRVRSWADELRNALLTGSDSTEEPEKAVEERRKRARVARWECWQRTGETAVFAVIVAVFYHFLLILSGAPVARLVSTTIYYIFAQSIVCRHVANTALFSTLLSVLTAVPATYVYRPPFDLASLFRSQKNSPSDSLARRLTWVRLFSELS
jgi:GPI ethanolamine phosphate transferase 2/3 subunit F